MNISPALEVDTSGLRSCPNPHHVDLARERTRSGLRITP
jgi:hypothetical protein